MAEEKTFTQADIDKVTAQLASKVEEFENKYKGAMDDLKKTQRELRAKEEIKPEDFQRLEEENDKLRGELAAANKQAKEATAAAEKATQALEAETGASRAYALEAELAGAIAEGNVVPDLIPGFKAMWEKEAQAELVDGKYLVKIGDKPVREAIKTYLDGDGGKAWRAASHNSGGAAPGGNATNVNTKTVTRAEFDAMNHVARSAFSKDGGKVVDQAA